MLGVRRQGVTEAANKLQDRGRNDSIQPRKIKVVNRTKLEARVCERYITVKQEYERLMSGVRTEKGRDAIDKGSHVIQHV